MKKGWMPLLWAPVLLAAGLWLAFALARMHWNRRIAKAAAELAQGPYSRAPLDAADTLFQNLPPPVKRYFEFAWRDRTRLIAQATLSHKGEFRTGGAKDKWIGFTSNQIFVSNPPGFLWNASMRMLPLVPVAVRDGYSRGAALMEAKAAYLFTVARMAGTRELASGELHRFLAEGVWLPTVLLPGNGMAWEALNDSSARATLTDGDISVSLDFFFNPNGGIARAFTASRYMDKEGKAVQTPWECAYKGYAERDGFMVPLEGEAAWILPEGRSSYYRAVVEKIGFATIPR